MVNIALMILGGIGLIIQFSTRNIQENDKPIFLLYIQYVAMGLIILLGGYSQYVDTKEDMQYKRAVLEVDVLTEVSNLFLPVVEDMAVIQNNMLSIKQYHDFERIIKKYPEIVHLLGWHNNSFDSNKLKLKTVKDSLHRIKRVAAKISQISIKHDGIIPDNTISWVKETLEINLSNIEEFFDPYGKAEDTPKTSVLNYHERTGEAFGSVFGKIRISSKIIKG